MRFHIVLPLIEHAKAGEKKAPAKSVPVNPSLPEGFTILLVEDDEKFRAWLGRFLRREGAIVLEAENGLTAIDRLGTNTVDVILSDFKMPVMDGLELCHWIKKERPEYLSRFCFLTGITEPALSDFSKERSITILMKPVRKRQLLAALVQVYG